MKTLKMILLTAIIAVPLYIIIVNPLFETFQPTSKTVQENNYEDDDVETIEDQEVHIDGFPVIYIEGNNEIYKDDWKTFSSELQKRCNIPWLTKNVSSIHFCSYDVFCTYGHKGDTGFARPYDNSVYILETGDAGYDETIIHEFGHIYDFTYEITSSYDISVLKENQNKVCKNNGIGLDGDYCLSDCEETFADAIRLYALYPETDYLPKEVSDWIDTLPR